MSVPVSQTTNASLAPAVVSPGTVVKKFKATDDNTTKTVLPLAPGTVPIATSQAFPGGISLTISNGVINVKTAGMQGDNQAAAAAAAAAALGIRPAATSALPATVTMVKGHIGNIGNLISPVGASQVATLPPGVTLPIKISNAQTLQFRAPSIMSSNAAMPQNSLTVKQGQTVTVGMAPGRHGVATAQHGPQPIRIHPDMTGVTHTLVPAIMQAVTSSSSPMTANIVQAVPASIKQTTTTNNNNNNNSDGGGGGGGGGGCGGGGCSSGGGGAVMGSVKDVTKATAVMAAGHAVPITVTSVPIQMTTTSKQQQLHLHPPTIITTSPTLTAAPTPTPSSCTTAAAPSATSCSNVQAVKLTGVNTATAHLVPSCSLAATTTTTTTTATTGHRKVQQQQQQASSSFTMATGAAATTTPTCTSTHVHMLPTALAAAATTTTTTAAANHHLLPPPPLPSSPSPSSIHMVPVSSPGATVAATFALNGGGGGGGGGQAVQPSTLRMIGPAMAAPVMRVVSSPSPSSSSCTPAGGGGGGGGKKQLSSGASAVSSLQNCGATSAVTPAVQMVHAAGPHCTSVPMQIVTTSLSTSPIIATMSPQPQHQHQQLHASHAPQPPTFQLHPPPPPHPPPPSLPPPPPPTQLQVLHASHAAHAHHASSSPSPSSSPAATTPIQIQAPLAIQVQAAPATAAHPQTLTVPLPQPVTPAHAQLQLPIPPQPHTNTNNTTAATNTTNNTINTPINTITTINTTTNTANMDVLPKGGGGGGGSGGGGGGGSDGPALTPTPTVKSEDVLLPCHKIKIEPDNDPVNSLDWQNGIAALPGSNIKFQLNEFGIMEIVKDDDLECIETLENSSDAGSAEITDVTAKPDHTMTTNTECNDLSKCVHKGCTDTCSCPDCKYSCNSSNCNGGNCNSSNCNGGNCNSSNCNGNTSNNSNCNGSNCNSSNCSISSSSSSVSTSSSNNNNNNNSNNNNNNNIIISNNNGRGTKRATVEKDECLDRKRRRRIAGSDPTATTMTTTTNNNNNNSSSSSNSRQAAVNCKQTPVVVKHEKIEEDGKKAATSLAAGKKSKVFTWAQYLDQENAVGAPTKLFKEPFPVVKNGFKIGMKLEGIDPKHQSLYCVLSVAEVRGFRIRLHFDGYSECYDFWVNADCLFIFPVGWCEKNGRVLQPPKGFSSESFVWSSYLKHAKAFAAPRHLFVNLPTQPIVPNLFRVGMKLEAVDKKNTSLICVATVADVLGDRILVHFDGWEDVYDYWCDPTSPYIHSVGWCTDNNEVLSPPCDWKDPANFSWDHYLAQNSATAVPARAFRPRAPIGFEEGMKIEVVDKRNPILVRVATIASTAKQHRVKIHFDGWLDIYDYWLDDDSPDIHPPGWCNRTGHTLQPPFSPGDLIPVQGQGGCPTPGCKGIGHIKGAKYAGHHSASGCSYSRLNLNKETTLQDRLGSTRVEEGTSTPIGQRPARAIEPSTVSMEMKRSDRNHRDKNCVSTDDSRSPDRCGTPEARLPKLGSTDHQDSRSAAAAAAADGRRFKYLFPNKVKEEKVDRSFETTVEDCHNNTNSGGGGGGGGGSESSQLHHGVHRSVFVSAAALAPSPSSKDLPLCWEQHSKLLPGVDKIRGDTVAEWKVDDVANFIKTLPGCIDLSKVFREEHIDGESFLMLNQSDIVKILNCKLGPALKIFNSILMFRSTADID